MRIKQINIQDFKFHSKLDLTLTSKNTIVYGENGSGKSSIYWALYSIFKVYFRNKNFDYTKYKKLDTESFKISISLDDTILSLPNTKIILPTNIEKETCSTIYFANQDLFNIIIDNKESNFYKNMEINLIKYFPNLLDICNTYNQINETMTNENIITKNDEKIYNDIRLKRIFKDLENLCNDILQNKFQENIKVNFEITDGLLDEMSFKFNIPTINILINNIADIKLHFNEAKLKLVAIAIYFSFILLNENKFNKIKILVLDDFLTSLDMANRHYIIDYVFKLSKNLIYA